MADGGPPAPQTLPVIPPVVPPVLPVQLPTPPAQPIVSPAQPIQPGLMPQLNGSHVKPEFTGSGSSKTSLWLLKIKILSRREVESYIDTNVTG